MPYNIIGLWPKEYINTSENDKETSWYLYYTKRLLVTTTDTVIKGGNTDMVDKKRKTKPNLVKEYVTPPFSAKKKIDTVNKIDH